MSSHPDSEDWNMTELDHDVGLWRWEVCKEIAEQTGFQLLDS